MRRATVVIVVLIAAAVVGPAIATAQSGGNTTNASENTTSDEYSHLRNGGETIPGADPSMRWLSGSGAVFVEYPGANPITSRNTEEWQVENVLANGALVRVNELTFHAQRMRSAPAANYTLHVVYWTTQTQQTENGTITRTQVQSRETKALSFEGPFDQQTVTLQNSDSQRRVTMWLEDGSGQRVDGAQWTFRHESIATTQSAGIETMGDYLWRAVTEFLAPIGLGVFAVGMVATKAVRKARKGPGYGYGPWIFVLSMALIAGMIWQFTSLADMLVKAPMIAAAFISGLVGIVIIEGYEANTKQTLFLRPHLVDVANPRGEDAVDSMLGDATEETLVELNGGQQAVVRSGLLPFLSRCFGGMAKLTPTRPMTTEMQLVDSKWDQVVWVDPDADETLDYDPEGWTLEPPELAERGDYLRVGMLGLVLAGVVGTIAGAVSWPWALAVGVVLILGYCATPTETSATVEPATGHERAALVSMMYLAQEHDDAETIESARQKLIEERASSERDVDEALETQDATLIEEMFGSDVDRRITDDGASSSSEETDDGDDDRLDEVDRVAQRLPEVYGDDD